MTKTSILITLSLLLFISCKKNKQIETRSFYMGVTPWPADFTQQELDVSYNFINNHCDLVSHHFDEGIPYEEAYKNKNWPAHFLADLQTRKTKTAAGKKILLSSSALNLSRKHKADYYLYSETISSTVKTQWEQLPVNDARVVSAYVNYISFIDSVLQPSYINFGVESNLDTWATVDFLQYKDFISKVYSVLKNRYPTIPIFISVMVNPAAQSIEYASQLMVYSDYLTLSAYPYGTAGAYNNGKGDPSYLPASFFDNYINLAGGKPIAFAETGYIAEDLTIPSFNVNLQSNSSWQKDYLEKIFKITNDNKGKFIVWFCSKDYDAGNNTLRNLGLFTDLFLMWEDTGLIDENNTARPALTSWETWMKKKKIE
jgi:hypothetical protein